MSSFLCHIAEQLRNDQLRKHERCFLLEGGRPDLREGHGVLQGDLPGGKPQLRALAPDILQHAGQLAEREEAVFGARCAHWAEFSAGMDFVEFKIPNYNQLNDEGGTEVETQTLFADVRSSGRSKALEKLVSDAIDHAQQKDPQLDLTSALVCDPGVLLLEFQNTVNQVLRAKFPQKPNVPPLLRFHVVETGDRQAGERVRCLRQRAVLLLLRLLQRSALQERRVRPLRQLQAAVLRFEIRGPVDRCELLE